MNPKWLRRHLATQHGDDGERLMKQLAERNYLRGPVAHLYAYLDGMHDGLHRSLWTGPEHAGLKSSG